MRDMKVKTTDSSDSSGSKDEHATVPSDEDLENETYEARVMKTGVAYEK